MTDHSWILGIDTGGTYTDAVLFDPVSRAVAHTAKSPTTHAKLSTGILSAIRKLPREALAQVCQVSLSTTLATNACVEGRHGPVTLCIVGGSKKVVTERWQEFGLPQPEEILFLPGDVKLDGSVENLPSMEELAALLRGHIFPGDCVAVAGMLSNRNPVCEYAVAEAAKRLGAYTVCSRDVAPRELNLLRRAATALLNGRLIPVIGEFLKEMRLSLDALGITSPVYIVRSDGGLMSEAFAADHPVETLLCGPSASVSGVLALTDGLENALIADIGGTTTDLALIRDGQVVRTENGADIGGYRLSLGSACMETIGLGGDSRLYLDSHGALSLDEKRAEPICSLAARYGSSVLTALQALIASPYQGLRRTYEFFELVKMPEEVRLSETDAAICQALKEGPLPASVLAEQVGLDIYRMNTDHLEETGAILRCGFTLTDAMHLMGSFSAYDSEASRLAARYFTRILEIDEAELCRQAMELACRRLYRAAVRLILRQDAPDIPLDGGVDALIHLAYKSAGGLSAPAFPLNAALVGVGAPAAIFVPPAAEALSATAVLPPHGEVANAAGAAASVIHAEYAVEIRADNSPAGVTFLVLDGSAAGVYEEVEAAMEEAACRAEAGARALARSRGLLGELAVTVRTQRHLSTAATQDGDVTVDLGATVIATAGSSEV